MDITIVEKRRSAMPKYNSAETEKSSSAENWIIFGTDEQQLAIVHFRPLFKCSSLVIRVNMGKGLMLPC